VLRIVAEERLEMRDATTLTPRFAGAGPRAWGVVARRLVAVAWAIGCGPLGTGCMASQDEQVLNPVVLGMTSQVPATYSDGQVSIYQVSIPVPLPMRRWSDEEAQAFGRSPPLPRSPFLRAEDARIEGRFTLTNVDDKRQSVELLLDPWNEFVRYRPGISVADEDALPNFSGFQKSFVLDPKQRVEGTITPDDMRELAIDLATAQAIAANPPPQGAQQTAAGLMNRAFNLQNRSNQSDAVLAPFLPAVVPGLVGFDLGLRTSAPANIAVEIIVDVKDLHGDRVVARGEATRTIGTPSRVLSPP
jgi:hypothetical protein